MSDELVARPGWLEGDCVRMTNGKKQPEKHLPPDDVTKTYGHIFLHETNWSETHNNRENILPSLYVTVFREMKCVLEEKRYWDDTPERVRLVKKEGAAVSFVVSGIDDFWIEDHGDRYFVVLTNMRSGKKLIRFLLHREWLPEIAAKLGISLLP